MIIYYLKNQDIWYIHSILSFAEKEFFVNWIFTNHIVNELIRWDKIISTLTSAKYKILFKKRQTLNAWVE